MKNTQFKVEDVFGDICGNEATPPEQITNLHNFLGKLK